MKSSRIFLIGTLALISLIVFSVALQQYAQRSRAAASTANIIFFPQADGNFGITAEAKPDEKISAVDVQVTVENGTISSWNECATFDNEDLQFTELISKTGASARYSCAVIKDKDQLPHQFILTGQVKCTDDSKPAKLTISPKSSVAGPVEGALYTNKIGVAVEIPCGDGEPQADEDVITSYGSFPTCTAEVGGSCVFGLEEIAQKGKKLSAVYMKLSYDPEFLTFTSLASTGGFAEPIPKNVLGLFTGEVKTLAQAVPTPPPSLTGNPTPIPTAVMTPTATPTATITPTTVPTTTPTASPSATPSPTTTPKPDGCRLYTTPKHELGIIEYVYICSQPSDMLLSKMVQAFDFKAKAVGKGEIKMLAVQAVGPATSGKFPAPYTVKKSTATYTIGGGGPQDNIKLDMKVRLQCVVKKPKGVQKLNVRVGLGDGKLKKPIFETGEFTVDDKGFWNGSVAFKAPAGSQYKLLVKGDKHMQKKVCEATPVEDFPGAYSCDKGKISLKDGSNTIDLTRVIMLTGDLPPGEQDGISNAKDQSLVRNLIGKRDEESAKLADINFDGVVNAVDHSCMIAALSVRWDEE